MKTTRTLIYDEKRVLAKYFSLSLSELVKHLDQELAQQVQGEILIEIIRNVLKHFTTPTLRKPADFGTDSRRVEKYLNEVQQFVCSHTIPAYHVENVSDTEREAFENAIAISDLIANEAPRSIYTKASPILIAVIIVKMGINHFCQP